MFKLFLITQGKQIVMFLVFISLLSAPCVIRGTVTHEV